MKYFLWTIYINCSNIFLLFGGHCIIKHQNHSEFRYILVLVCAMLFFKTQASNFIKYWLLKYYNWVNIIAAQSLVFSILTTGCPKKKFLFSVLDRRKALFTKSLLHSFIYNCLKILKIFDSYKWFFFYFYFFLILSESYLKIGSFRLFLMVRVICVCIFFIGV